MRFSKTLDIENCVFIFGSLALAAVLVPLEIRHSLQHWSEWVVFLVMFSAVGLGITAGYHRLFSHRAYQASWPVRLVLLCLAAASFESSALSWASDHRLHHSKVDQEEDPYNSRKGFWFSHWLWLFNKRARRLLGVNDLVQDPLVRWQHRHHFLIGVIVALCLPVAVGLATGNLFGHLVIGGLLRIVLTQHSTWLVNSVAHAVGDRPYSDSVSARDNALLAFFTWGEGYHNYHHVWQWDYRNGVRWYQWDPTKWLVKSMAWLGLVHGLRQVPAARIESSRLHMKNKVFLEKSEKEALSL